MTADQFNYGMSAKNKFAPVILCVGLPHGMQVEEPIDDCQPTRRLNHRASLLGNREEN